MTQVARGGRLRDSLKVMKVLTSAAGEMSGKIATSKKWNHLLLRPPVVKALFTIARVQKTYYASYKDLHACHGNVAGFASFTPVCNIRGTVGSI